MPGPAVLRMTVDGQSVAKGTPLMPVGHDLYVAIAYFSSVVDRRARRLGRRSVIALGGQSATQFAGGPSMRWRAASWAGGYD
jgi:hypothetical protein